MTLSPAYEEYAVTADFYDYSVPYRNRPDVAFFVEMATQSAGLCGLRQEPLWFEGSR